MSDILTDTQREKLDDSSDQQFYDQPRFVTHADDGFLRQLTALYSDVLTPGDRVFDAMSSWVSHLPTIQLDQVVGHGLNEQELAANDRLDDSFVQDLNKQQRLPLAENSFDLVCCALSVQYLQYPGAVFSEFGRVTEPGGQIVVSFTNRMFPTKAVRAWRAASMDERTGLVKQYLDAGGFDTAAVRRKQPEKDPFFGVVGRLRSGSDAH